MPFRATSIIPPEKQAPTSTPMEATVRITRTGAALEPMAELRKLTASFATPLIKSNAARSSRAVMIIQ